MALSTPSPVKIDCAVCNTATWAHKMATIQEWVVIDGQRAGTIQHPAPWCQTCEKRRSCSSELGYSTQRAVIALKSAWLTAQWDGKEQRQCIHCKEEKPITHYPWRTWSSTHKQAFRTRGCFLCMTGEYRKRRAKGTETARREKEAPVSAFSITEAQIRRRTGLPIERWGQREHDAQCILMRDLCGLPQHAVSDDITCDDERITLWKNRVNSTKAWVAQLPSHTSAYSPLSP